MWVLMVASQPEGVDGRRYEHGGMSRLMLCKIDMWNVFGAGQDRCFLDLQSESVNDSVRPTLRQGRSEFTVSQCVVSTTNGSATSVVTLQFLLPRSHRTVSFLIALPTL